MRSTLEPARVAPNVPSRTIDSAGTLKKAGSLLPSIIAPMASPANATPMPMAVVAFIKLVERPAGLELQAGEGGPFGGFLRFASWPVGELATGLGRQLANWRTCQLGVTQAPRIPHHACTPLAYRRCHGFRRLRHHDLVPGRERHDRVGMRLDRCDQVGVQVERLGVVPEAVQLDHEALLVSSTGRDGDPSN